MSAGVSLTAGSNVYGSPFTMTNIVGGVDIFDAADHLIGLSNPDAEHERQDGRTGEQSVHCDPPKQSWLLSGFGVVSIGLRDQGGDESAEQGLSAAAGVVHELEEAEVEPAASPARCRDAGATRSAAATRSPPRC